VQSIFTIKCKKDISGDIVLITLVFFIFSMKSFFATNSDIGLALLRIGVGVMMLPFGLMKLGFIAGQGSGIEATIGFMTGAGIPWIVAVLVIIAESIGALSLIFGFCTRFCAASLAVIMGGAIYMMFGSGYFAGYQSMLLFLLVFVVLVINGGGAWSVDAAIVKKVK
jgi:putative oxidoreductase